MSDDTDETTGESDTTSTSTNTSESEAELTASDGIPGVDRRQEFQMRYALAQALGESIPGDKDYYEVFNWDKNPTVDDYFALALRNPYAYAVTFMPVETAWRDTPRIVDKKDPDGDDDTEFETAVDDLVEDQRLWHYCRRAHKLAGIGKFGVLLIEFDDIDGPDGLAEPVGTPDGVRGFRPFSRASITDVKLGAPGTDRWGQPREYQLDFSDENETEGVIQREGRDQVWVNWQRVIHIPSDGLLDDEIRGIERQKPVYNNLVDIERTLGAAGHLAYRAAAWGIHVNIDKDFSLDDDGEALREHLYEWRYGLEDILRTHGADEVQSLGGENIDPSPIIDSNIEAISAQTGIPQSILKGNETGERATSEDLKAYYGQVAEDRAEFISPQIVRETLDRLRMFDLLPDPVGDGYLVEWPPLAELSESDQADVEKTRAQTLKEWPLADQLLTPEQQREYVKTGSLPTELDTQTLPPLDETDSDVAGQFDAQFDSADAVSGDDD